MIVIIKRINKIDKTDNDSDSKTMVVQLITVKNTTFNKSSVNASREY